MNDFVFEETPWEQYLNALQGNRASALHLLTLLEGEEEEDAREVLESLDERGVLLDLTDLQAIPAGQAALRLKQESEFAKSGIDCRSLEPGDPLRLYLKEVAAIPAFGDEAVFAMELQQGSQEAAGLLTNLGLSKVISLASAQAGKGVLLLDLIQEGNLGLWNAISSYCGGDYAAHRDFYIQNAIARAIAMQARSNGLGQKMRAAMEDYRGVDERLLSDLGRNATVEEIAEELHMDVEQTLAIRKMMDDARLLNMAVQPMEEKVEEPEENEAVEDTAYFRLRSRIMELLSVLDEEDAKLLSLRFGLEGGLPQTPAQIGNVLGMTADEVTRREAALLARLRQQS